MGPGNPSFEKQTSTAPVLPLRATAAPSSSTATASTIPKPSSVTASTTASGPAKAPSLPLPERLPPPPSIDPAPPIDGLTPEQRRAVWEKRIALIADATQEYMDLGKLEKDVQSRRRQFQLPAFDTLPSDVKDAFRAGLKNAEASCERKKVSLNSSIDKLSETDFWLPIPSQKVGDMEARLKEAKTLLGGLADSVSQLYKRIESLHGQRYGHPGTKPSSADDGAKTAGEAAGDGDSRKKKRQRLSIGGSDAVADTVSHDVRDDIESITDTIREIEDRLLEVENDMTQHSRNILEQLEVNVDEKIEEIARSADISALVEAQLRPQTAQTIQAFDESLAQADRDIGELAHEMADLISQLDVLQRDDDLTTQQYAADRESLAQLMKADQENAEAITRLQEEAKTLRSALTAHATRALPAEPALPLSGPFMEAIKTTIVAQVHEQILPIVTQTRAEIERIAETRDVELYEKLRDKLNQSSKMSQLISTWIEHNPDAAAARAQIGGAGSSD
ncbi:hypothetical protein F5148DRAFT_769174 [Russula earlei]|uniref:Uncharacterized protein n=1 Tax=Russula earlei TaxID=71964 RepID=A0ACC0UEB4_9AGAM|nr:hypothetical protein F5148DRAFT_769174 [Russula earlei]